MSAILRRLIGAIKVYEQGSQVHVEGLDTENLIDAITSVWRTSKISNNLFTHVDGSSFIFNTFFTPDLIYVLKVILEQRPKGISIRGLEKLIGLLHNNTWLLKTDQKPLPFLNRSVLKKFIYTPLPHQEAFFNNYEEMTQRFQLTGYLLSAAPGSGKTAISLMMGEMLETDVNIFIVPKNAIDLVWADSFKKLYKNPPKWWVSSSKEMPTFGRRNYAFHYERIGDAVDFLKKHPFKKTMIWLDESHNLNEISSTRTQKFLELVKVARTSHCVWASGTPIKAMGREVIPLLKSIDPLFNEDAEKRFTGIFGQSASRALDILNARIGKMTHTTTKEEFRPSKPTIEDVLVKIPNGDDYTLDSVRIKMKQFIIERVAYYEKNMRLYVNLYEECLSQFSKTLHSEEEKETFKTYCQYIRTIRKDYSPMEHKEMVKFCNQYEIKTIVPELHHNYREGFKEARTIVKYYFLKVQGEALGRVLGQLRDQCIVDMVKYCGIPEIIDNAVSKTLIFTTAVGAVKEANSYLMKEGYSPLMVYGETNKDLPSIVERYKKIEDINPLIATYASLSTAVPLVMANTCIMLNVPFREYIYTQAISRVDRIGQEQPVFIFNMYLDTGTKPNLSTRSGDILDWCKEQVEAIMGRPMVISDNDSVAIECIQDKTWMKPIIEETNWIAWAQ